MFLLERKGHKRRKKVILYLSSSIVTTPTLILTALIVFPRCFQWRPCFILPFLLHSMLLFGSIWYTTAHKVKENNEVGAGETLLKVGHGNECVCE